MSNKFEISLNPCEAEIIIINTCAFIKDAKEESIETIIEMANYKQIGNCKLLVVTGCLSQRYYKELEHSLPEVDLFIGIGEYNNIAQIIEKKLNQSENAKKSFVKKEPSLYDPESLRILSTPHYTCYIKISEGCSRRCSFCVIPKIRGRYRSRRIDSIIKEIEKLSNQGVKEFNLVAQDLTYYGKDLKDKTSLEVLLKEICKIDKVKWIRLLYCYPDRFTNSLLELIGREEKICKYIDIPIQHINDKILAKMRRGTKGEDIRKLIKRIREIIPDVALRTSLIVGFPGESQEAFEELKLFVEETRFNHLGVFTYSDEEDTYACKLLPKIPKKIKEKRKREIMRIQKSISKEILKGYVGKVVDVLIEGKSDETEMLLKGRLSIQAPDIDGIVYINKGIANAGIITPVLITKALYYDLVAEIL